MKCPHCGGEMQRSTALVCGPRGVGRRLELPPYCPSKECQEARDEAVLADLVARGVIDP